VGPVAARQNCHGPFVLFDVRVALKVNPLALTLHPVKVGLLTVTQSGVPQAAGVVPLVEDAVHVTVAVPSLKLTLLDDAVNAVPDGVTQSASASWAPSPSTAANADAAR
jgi:hypothetical protein